MKTLVGTLSAIAIGVVAYTAFAEQHSLSSSDTPQLVSQPSELTAPAEGNEMPNAQLHPESNTGSFYSHEEGPNLNEGSSGDSGLNIQ